MTPLEELQEALKRKYEGRPVWDWFAHRVRSHNQAKRGIPTEAFQGIQASRKVEDKLSKAGLGDRPRVIYIHIPFCQKLCSFCAFIRKPYSQLACQYSQSLLQAIDAVSQTPWAKEKPFEAVFIGGGTPTALPVDHLCKITDRISNSFQFVPDYEFTIESRFMGIDETYLNALSNTAVNRLSFGVQSFDTTLRRDIGRVVDRETILVTLDMALRKHFRSVSVDLIYNLPGQSNEQWNNDLETLLNADVSGASLYPLIPFEQSALMKKLKKNNSGDMLRSDQEYYFSMMAQSKFASHPEWKRFAPSHIGKDGIESSVYNESRLGTKDVLGIGSGAGGSIDNLSYMNCMAPDEYGATVEKGRLPIEFSSQKPWQAIPRMQAYNLLSEKGLDICWVKKEYQELVPIIEYLERLQLVHTDQSRIKLTENGCFWSYNITSLISRTIAQSLEDLGFSV